VANRHRVDEFTTTSTKHSSYYATINPFAGVDKRTKRMTMGQKQFGGSSWNWEEVEIGNQNAVLRPCEQH